MTRIKFKGDLNNEQFSASVTQDGVTVGPLTIASVGTPSGGGGGGTATFDAFVSVHDENWTPVVEGQVIEVVATARIRTKMENFAGFADNDILNIWGDVDYGERYTLEHVDHPQLPQTDVLLRLGGDQAGYYPGLLSGHAMRGTDMAGNQVLTATHDQGNGAPTGTLDKIVTMTGLDGAGRSHQVTFTIRLIHPDVFYADLTKAIFTQGQEQARGGTLVLSRDGDFTGAPSGPTVTQVTLPNGEFTAAQVRTLLGLSWGDEDTATRCLFKAGETYTPTTQMGFRFVGKNGTYDTWYHSGPDGDQKARLGATALQSFDPTAGQPLFRDNVTGYSGARLLALVLDISDYDPSDVTWREWWNVLNYTGKAGAAFVQNTSETVSAGFNGETLTNGNGVYTQVIHDDGAGTLICRQVVDTSDVDDASAAQAFFGDGQTLTGQTSGGTVTFVDAGSRQDRTRKVPSSGIFSLSADGLLIDGVEVHGAETGIGGMGLGAVVSDTLLSNCWNYQMQQTGGDVSMTSLIGVVGVQPLNYEGTPRDFGGSTVSANRNFFNAMIGAATSGDANLATNDISHAFLRLANIIDLSIHNSYCHHFGGHGGGHQPGLRLGTQGTLAEDVMFIQIYGCGFAGGGTQITFSLAGGGTSPKTPKAIRVEACHLLGTHATTKTNFVSIYTNFVLRNSILDRQAGPGTWPSQSIEWVSTPPTDGQDSYAADTDTNARESFVEFCTMRALLNTTPASSVTGPQYSDIRGTPVTYRNNAHVIDQAVIGTVEVAILAQADAPSDFDSGLHPLASAGAYQNAEEPIAYQDASQGLRSASNASRGALEPV